MNMNKALSFILNVLILTLLLLIPFSQSSISSSSKRMNMAGSSNMVTNMEVGGARLRNEDGGASVGRSIEDSARRVPTGPDPLHHNNNPILRP